MRSQSQKKLKYSFIILLKWAPITFLVMLVYKHFAVKLPFLLSCVADLDFDSDVAAQLYFA